MYEYIYKYITTNFKLETNDAGFFVRRINNNEELSERQFYIEIDNIFGSEDFEKDWSPNKIAIIWISARGYDLTKEVNKYFNNFSVKLGNSSWHLLDNNGVVIDKEDIKFPEFQHLSPKLVSKLFDMWYETKIIQTTEKTMNI